MTEREWLDSLKAGDEVALAYGFGSRSYNLVAVTRTTRTQVFVGRSAYRRKTGRPVGSGMWDSVRLCEPTDRIRTIIAREDAVRYLRDVDWQRLETPDVLRIAGEVRALMAAVKAAEQSK